MVGSKTSPDADSKSDPDEPLCLYRDAAVAECDEFSKPRCPLSAEIPGGVLVGEGTSSSRAGGGRGVLGLFRNWRTTGQPRLPSQACAELKEIGLV